MSPIRLELKQHLSIRFLLIFSILAEFPKHKLGYKISILIPRPQSLTTKLTKKKQKLLIKFLLRSQSSKEKDILSSFQNLEQLGQNEFPPCVDSKQQSISCSLFIYVIHHYPCTSKLNCEYRLDVLKLTLFLTVFWSGVIGYSIVYEKNYETLGNNCSTDSNFEWRNIFPDLVTNCVQYDCNFLINQSKSYLNVDQPQIKFHFKIPEQYEYSQIGIDITYYSTFPQIKLTLEDVSVDANPNNSNYIYEYDSEEVFCQIINEDMRLQQAQIILGRYIFQREGILQIEKSNSVQFLGIRSIRIWVNCSPNCKSCDSFYNCGTCLDTFTKHLEQKGRSVSYSCEVIEGCAAGCQQCYQEFSIIYCSICQAGFSLNSTTRQCEAHILLGNTPCLEEEYINSQGSCLPYSINSYYEGKDGAGWMLFAIDDPMKYRCNDGELVLKYDKYNYELFRCGCTIQNCAQCNTIDICQKCKVKYYLTIDQLSCNKCNLKNCKDCSESQGFSCTICEDGFSFNITKNICQQICSQNEYFDFESISCKSCDSGREIDSDGNCVCINSSQKFDSKLGFCLSEDGIVGELKDKVSIEGYVLTVDFQADLVVYVGQDIGSVLSIEISHGSRTEFSFEVKEIRGKSISVSLVPQINFKQELVTLLLKDPVFISQNNIKTVQYEKTLKTFIFYNEGQKSAIQATSSIGEVTVMTIIGTIIPIAIFSNFYVLINTIDLTAFLYYLLFIDVRYPENVLSFFEFFQNFQFPFIPSMFESIISPDYVQDAPQKFIDNGFQPYFLSNSGQSITIVLFILAVYAVGKIFSFVEIPKLQPYLKRAMSETWEYSVFFDLLWSLYIYFLIGSLLQFMVYDSGEENYIMNYILHSIFAIIHIASPFLITYFIYKQKNLKSDKVFRMKYSTLVGGLELYDESKPQQQIIPNESIDQINISKDYPHSNLVSERNNLPDKLEKPENELKFENEKVRKLQEEQYQVLSKENDSSQLTKRKQYQVKLSKMYNPFLYQRKLMFSIVIVFMTSLPYLQLTLITILNIIMGSYILYIMPLDHFQENIKNATGEAILIMIQICVMFLVSDDKQDDENHRISIGWIIIGLSAFIMLWHTLQLLLETIKSLFVALKSLFTSKKKSNETKVHAIEQHEIQMIKKQLKPETADKTCQQSIQGESPELKRLAVEITTIIGGVTNNQKTLETQKQFTQTEFDASTLQTRTSRLVASQRNSQISLKKLIQYASKDNLKQQQQKQIQL